MVCSLQRAGMWLVALTTSTPSMTLHIGIPRTRTGCLVDRLPLGRPVALSACAFMVLTYLWNFQASFYIRHICICCIFCIFRIQWHIFVGLCITGHAYRLAILKSAAWYSLTEEELDEILLCNDQPVLEGYVNNLFKSAVRLWKCVMPVESRKVFQTKIFHPAFASEELQKHLGVTMTQLLFDM